MAKSESELPTTGHATVVLEFSVLDDAAKKSIASCIERKGKVTVTMTHVGKSDGKAASYTQID
jgi:hypothetical protein